MAGNGGNAGFGRELLGGDLVAHGLDGADRRADEGDAFLLQRGGEGGVFGEKAVARMHRIGTGLADRLQDALDDDVGLGRRRRTDMHRLIRHLHMQRIAVGIRIDRDGGDAQTTGRLDDAAGDFAAIGDEDLLEHQSGFRVSCRCCLCIRRRVRLLRCVSGAADAEAAPSSACRHLLPEGRRDGGAGARFPAGGPLVAGPSPLGERAG